MRNSLIVTFSLIIIANIGNNVQGQVKQSTKDWKMVANDYLVSYGQECDILVFKDHTVVRDIFLFTPSIITKLKDIQIPGNRLFINIRIEKKGVDFLIENIQIRIFDNLKVIHDEATDSYILNSLKELKVEMLKNTTFQNSYNFGIAFKCSSCLP